MPRSKASTRTPSKRRKTTAKPKSRARVISDPGGIRLSPDVRPTNVDLHVEVDPTKSELFRGDVSIEIEIDQACSLIELHASDLNVTAARIESSGATGVGSIEPRPKRETIALRFRQKIPAGTATLKLRFSGNLRSDLRGLYAASSGTRRYAVTQLEAADARRFFPCFDEPIMKARFAIRVTTGARNQVISNSPILRTQKLSGGKKTVHFAPTPPLSTYLVALAVGDFESSKPTRLGKTEIRVWHVPGKRRLTAFSLEAARETLARLEKYFNLPYPYAKLDLVAVPDFEAGAMENAGAVFFRETLLLVDPETVTLTEQKRVAEVICHELAHMWYGDLVTMEWWNDLWLNEAFATWMAFEIVASWKPEWEMWQDFELHRGAALNLDALDSTHPIYTEVKTPDEATENFDLITYEKGASVVRMLEHYLGAKAFRAGVRKYIRRHKESNTVASDLWDALSDASGERVEAVVRGWIEQPGYPVLKVRRRKNGSRTEIRFRQERFYSRAKKARGVPTRWPIPWVGRVGGARRGSAKLEKKLLLETQEKLSLRGAAPRFIYGNADESGFYRPLHDGAELGRIAKFLPELTPVERMGLLGHQWALVRAGYAEIESFLKLADASGAEPAAHVLQLLRAPLAFLDSGVAEPAGTKVRDAYRNWLAEKFGTQLLDLGWDPADREDDATRLRRAAIIALLGEVAEWDAVMLAAEDRCGEYIRDRTSLDANLADSVVSLAARRGDAALYDAYLNAADASSTPQGRRRFTMALAEFRDPSLVRRTLTLTPTDQIPTQDVAMLLARLFGNPAARELTWAFVKRRWSSLRRRMPPMLVTRLIDATPALSSREYRREVAAFFEANPVPTGARAVRQALERFDLNAEFRRRASPGFKRWLAANEKRSAR